MDYLTDALLRNHAQVRCECGADWDKYIDESVAWLHAYMMDNGESNVIAAVNQILGARDGWEDYQRRYLAATATELCIRLKAQEN